MIVMHCNHCNTNKPSTEFPPNERTRCKVCKNRQALERGYNRGRQTIYMARQQLPEQGFPVVRITRSEIGAMIRTGVPFPALRTVSMMRGLSYSPSLSIRTWWDDEAFYQQNVV